MAICDRALATFGAVTAERRWWRWLLCFVGRHPRGSVLCVREFGDLAILGFITRIRNARPVLWRCNNCGREWVGGEWDHRAREEGDAASGG